MSRSSHAAWQTTMADLSLILFMVALAALVQKTDNPAMPAPAQKAVQAAAEAQDAAEAGTVTQAGNPLPAEGEAAAVYRPGVGVLPLSTWLEEQGNDPRLQLTVIARYSGASVEQASAAALRLAREARSSGYAARIMLEPAAQSDLVAVLAYDRGAVPAGG